MDAVIFDLAKGGMITGVRLVLKNLSQKSRMSICVDEEISKG